MISDLSVVPYSNTYRILKSRYIIKITFDIITLTPLGLRIVIYEIKGDNYNFDNTYLNLICYI